MFSSFARTSNTRVLRRDLGRRHAGELAKLAIGTEHGRRIAQQEFSSDVSGMTVLEAHDRPRGPSSIAKVFPLEGMAVEVVPGFASAIEMNDPRRGQPAESEGVKSDMLVDDLSEVHALEIPDAIGPDPVVMQDEIERALVAPPEPVGVPARE